MTFKESLELGVDFMDLNEGVIYCIQDYSIARKFGFPTPLGVRVVESISGEIVGYVEESTLIEERMNKNL